MKDKIVIAGGSGFLGQILIHYLNQHYDLVILSREERISHRVGLTYLKWDGKTIGAWGRELNGAKAVINLVGRSVDCRYNDANKRMIINSRVNATRVIGEAIWACRQPPEVWINASSATIYRHSEDKEMGEESGEIGHGFSVEVCKKWERAFYEVETPVTRQVALRIAMVLGRQGGIFPLFMKLTKLGLGGKHAGGNQFISWLHEEDFAQLIHRVIEDNRIAGIFNLCAPNPVTDSYFMKAMRRVARMPFGLPQPTWMLKLGALILGTESELILKSRRVHPEGLLKHGLKWKFPTIDRALTNLSQG